MTKYDCLSEDDVIQTSRKKFARPRYAVESEINRWSSVMGEASLLHGEGTPASHTVEVGAHARQGVADAATVAAGRATETHRRDTPRESFSALAALGIEYQPEPQEPDRERSGGPPRQDGRGERGGRMRQPAPAAPPPRTLPTQPEVKKEETARNTKPDKTISLKDLKPRQDKPKHERFGSSVDIDELRDSISAALDSYISEPDKKDDGGQKKEKND